MNPATNTIILVRSGIKGVRASVLSRAMTNSPPPMMMTMTTMVIRPWSAVPTTTTTNTAIERHGVPLYRPFSLYSRFPTHRMESRFCYFSGSSNSNQGSNDDGGDDDNSSTTTSNNDSNNTSSNDSSNAPQSPFSSSPLVSGRTANSTAVRRKSNRKFVPRKAAVKLTEKARTLFQKLIENHPTKDGILLDYKQSSTGEPRMVFSFSFVSKDELHERDEGVSLEVDEDGTPKSPALALDDGLPKLYIHHNGFLKVLGAKVDVDTENITPVLYDKEGFELDANV